MPTTHSHTRSMEDGSKVDIHQLWRLTRHLPVQSVNIDDLKNFDFSKRTGFSRKRLVETDTKWPVLVGKDMTLLDGRHRVKKLLNAGLGTAQARFVPQSHIRKATIKKEAARTLFHIAPESAYNSIKQKGLLSSIHLARDPEALKAAVKPEDLAKWREYYQKFKGWDSQRARTSSSPGFRKT